MPVEVVDASALAAVLFGEPDGDAVVARLSGSHLVSPTLMRYELASVCRKKIRRHPDMASGLIQALHLFPRLGVEEVQVPAHELPPLPGQAGLTTYDAAYLWLARHLSAPLVTLDTALLEASRRTPRR